MTEYTPTTEEVRQAITYGEPAWGPMFDRWLAAHDAEVRASVLTEQGEPEWEYGYDSMEDAEAERPTTRRRKAGPWLPVEEGGATS
jgi:hypothetical protein